MDSHETLTVFLPALADLIQQFQLQVTTALDIYSTGAADTAVTAIQSETLQAPINYFPPIDVLKSAPPIDTLPIKGYN